MRAPKTAVGSLTCSAFTKITYTNTHLARTNTHTHTRQGKKNTHISIYMNEYKYYYSYEIMKSCKNLLKSASHFEIFGVRERDARLIKFLRFVITWINVSSWGLRCGCGTCLSNLLIAVALFVPSLSGHIWVHTYVYFHMHIKIGEPNCTELSYLNCTLVVLPTVFV